MSTKQIMRTMVYCGYLLIYNLIFFFIMGKFSVQGVQTRLKRNDRFEISDRVAN